MMSSGDRKANGPVLDASRVGLVLSASRVGAELRAARLRLGWALPDIAAKLRIRLHFLQAIEDGRVADLPGNTYAVGFLRSYAASLGLDAAEMARRFRAEAYEVNRKTALAFPAPMPDRSVPAGAVVLLGVLLMAGAYAGWYRSSGQVATEVVPAVPERLAALADRDALPNPPPQVAAIPSSSSTSALAAPMPVPPPAALQAPDLAPLATPPDMPATAAANEARVVLRITAEAWIQVRERQGPVLLNRVMRAGDVWPVPAGTQLVLSTGNAGGTELLVDGQPIPALGGSGAIRRDVPLDPDALKAVSTGHPPAQ